MWKPALLVNLASTLFMTGVMVFVRVVHYPLFEGVGVDEFRAYHARHVQLTTWVVAPPMLAELALSLVLVVVRPPGSGPVLVWAGLAAAVLTWGVTGLCSVPAHEVLSRGFDPDAHRRLTSTDLIRLAGWSAHSIILLATTWRALPD